MEMNWNWLLQIFRGEGEVTDVYVSQKRKSNYDYRFGFVRFKKLEEARKAIRNLNGVKIRKKIMKVSFTKYDKKDRPWNSSILQEANKVSKAVGREEKYTKDTNDGRTFKEVVEGLPHHSKAVDWVMKNHRNTVISFVDKNRIKA